MHYHTAPADILAGRERWRHHSQHLSKEAQASRVRNVAAAHKDCDKFGAFVALVDALLRSQMLDVARLAVSVAMHQVRGCSCACVLVHVCVCVCVCMIRIQQTGSDLKFEHVCTLHIARLLCLCLPADALTILCKKHTLAHPQHARLIRHRYTSTYSHTSHTQIFLPRRMGLFLITGHVQTRAADSCMPDAYMLSIASPGGGPGGPSAKPTMRQRQARPWDTQQVGLRLNSQGLE